jgi:hypothetical protein
MRKMGMKRIIGLAGICLTLSTAVADAKRMVMTDDELDKIVAGDVNYGVVSGTITSIVSTDDSTIITVLLSGQGTASVGMGTASISVNLSSKVYAVGVPGNVILTSASLGTSINIGAMFASASP